MTGTARPPYSIGVDIRRPHGLVLALVRTALNTEGFHVLTEIDVRATLADSHNGHFPHYVVLGAYNRVLAQKALKLEPDFGLILLCNVVVYEREGHTRVAALDPAVQLGITGREELLPILEEVRKALARAVKTVSNDKGPPLQEVV